MTEPTRSAPPSSGTPSDGPRELRRPTYDSPFLDRLLAEDGIDDTRAEQARRLRDDGYLVVEGLIEPELIDEIVGRYEWLFDPETEFDADPDELHRLELDTNRRQDAWAVCDPVRALASHAGVLDLLRFLYGREPIPFQTLNFRVGTTQSMHTDAMHFSSVPAGFMCGVWIALEDVTPDCGPLRYAPGSHRYASIQLTDLGRWAGKEGQEDLGPNYAAFERYLEALLEAKQAPIEELVCPKGTVLVWASDLVHGGAPIRDPGTTRLSQVTHYYFEDCTYYAPIFSDVALGEYALRDVRDIRTGEPVPHRLNGSELRTEDVGYRNCELHRLKRDVEGTGEEAPDPIAKLERERDEQRKHVQTIENDCAHQLAHIATLERDTTAQRAHIETLERDTTSQRAHIENLERERSQQRGHIENLEGMLGKTGLRKLYRWLRGK